MTRRSSGLFASTLVALTFTCGGRVGPAYAPPKSQPADATSAEPSPAASPTVPARGPAAVPTAAAVQYSYSRQIWACALDEDGIARCWGYGGFGTLGHGRIPAHCWDEQTKAFRCNHGPRCCIGDEESLDDASTIALARPATALAHGGTHMCAVLDDGTVQCWGRGTKGENGLGIAGSCSRDDCSAGLDCCLGDDETVRRARPLRFGKRVTALTAGVHHTCALLEDRSVRCWGDGTSGQLGHGNGACRECSDGPACCIGDDERGDTADPVRVGGRVAQLSAGHWHTCALLESGEVRCWGRGIDGQLGGLRRDAACSRQVDGRYEAGRRCTDGPGCCVGDDESPAAAGNVPVGGLVRQVHASANNTCAFMQGDALRCWGEDFIDERDRRRVIASDIPYVELAAAPAEFVTPQMCMLLQSGEIACVGSDDRSELSCARTHNGDITCWELRDTLAGPSDRWVFGRRGSDR